MVKDWLLPPKGSRDFPPEIQILRKEVFEKIERIFQKYGFDPIETPIVEKWETLAGKYGEEAENRLIWRFKLPYSNREFGLRYDLTVPLARFVARFRPKLPFKRYHIGRVFRYDEPQKGRYREFWQCDVDIVGSNSPLADAEILDIVIDVFEEFGFKNFVIKLNDRRILRGLFEKELELKNKQILFKIYRIIDKLDKIGKEKVLKEIREIIGNRKSEKIGELLEKNKLNNEEILEYLESVGNKNVEEGVSSISKILEFSKAKEKIKIDLSLVRGLDYYTGMIYEAIVEEPKIGSLSGGGRYDNLIELFAREKIPAVGGSIGVERLIDAGLELGLLKTEKKTYAKVGIIYTKEIDQKFVKKIADELRNLGINTYLSFNGIRNIADGIKDLEKRGIRYALIVGKREVENKYFTFQDLEERRRSEIESLEEVKKLIS